MNTTYNGQPLVQPLSSVPANPGSETVSVAQPSIQPLDDILLAFVGGGTGGNNIL